MPETVYLGTTSPAGAQLLRFAVGPQQGAGLPPMFDVTPHPIAPAGEGGVCVFRGLTCTVQVSDGYTLGVTPIIDDVPLPEQILTRSGRGVFVSSAPFYVRGTRVTARVRTIAAKGDFALVGMQTSFVALRGAPP